MKLGILVTTDRHLEDILGIAGAALSKGHKVIVFSMDEGARLLEDERFHSLCKQSDVTVSFCDLNATQRSIQKAGLSDCVTCGSQLNNARMVHEADRVIRL